MAATAPAPLGAQAPGTVPPPRGPKNGVHPHGADANGPVGHDSKTTHHKKKAHPKSRKPATYIFPTRTGDLAVDPGQITFEAEGNDIETSPFFSRKIIWPGKLSDGVGKGSGVTIGRGYDMGDRDTDTVAADLTTAGMDAKVAATYAEGAKLKGPGSDDDSAQGFVSSHRAKLVVMTTAVQKKLFEDIYPKYVTDAEDRYIYHSTKDATAWNSLKPAIRDVLVDMVYQGFGKKKKGYGKPLQAGMKNDYQTLIDYIDSSATMRSYEAGRHRADYLRAALAKEKAALPQPSPPVTPKP